MCNICGCSHGEITIGGSAEEADNRPDHGHGSDTHGHAHAGSHHRSHDHDHHGHSHASPAADVPFPSGGATPSPNLISIEQSILAKNQRFADENRSNWSGLGILSLNLVSSPGAGKTSLLVKTLEALRAEVPLWVIEGDQETSNDANRIRQTGVPAIQINTGRGCHLDARAVGHAAADLPLRQHGILFIENVGNLVCPAGFDLGETKRVVILSVTEGTDKPIKYPDAFAAADIMVLSKLDLMPHVDFDASAAIELAKRVNPAIRVVRASVTAEGGINEWLQWLRSMLREVVAAPAAQLESRLAAVRGRLSSF
jgi:hydrogenase nickel incorporation protein HypB